MNRKEFEALVKSYTGNGNTKEQATEIANRGLTWFIENHSAEFRASVEQAKYIEHNEYLWV